MFLFLKEISVCFAYFQPDQNALTMDRKTFRTLLVRLLPLFPLLTTCVPVPVPAQTRDPLHAMVSLSGASGAEELTEDQVERYEVFLARPLELNLASPGRLLSSGLLSRFQVASLLDYRRGHGDILSLSELSLLDGFGKDFAAALAPFVSLRSGNRPGAPVLDSLVWRSDLTARTAVRPSRSGAGWNYAVKYGLEAGERFGTHLSARSRYGDKPFPPETYSLNVTWYGRRRPGKVIAGDFSTRFGQGLTLWSGMSMTGFSSSSSFVRRPSGLSPSRSCSGIGTHRGVGADCSFGPFVVSSFLSVPGLRDWCERGRPPEISLLPGANLTWYGHSAQVSVTGFLQSPPLAGGGDGRPGAGKISADFRSSHRGVDLFGEGAWDVVSGTVAAVAGTSVLVLGDARLAGVVRCYPSGFSRAFASGVRAGTGTSDEFGIAAGFERGAAVLTADHSRKMSDPSNRQWKFLVKCPLQLAPTLVGTIRATERIRPQELLRYRTDLRLDLDWFSGGLDRRYGEASEEGWSARFRADGLVCRKTGFLTYLEGGRKSGFWNAFLRGTLFLVDSWDDRIYSYERDAPGNFNVPAYYGRGFSLSAVAGARIRLTRTWKMLKLYARASTIRYALMEAPKPSRTEFKFQMMLDL